MSVMNLVSKFAADGVGAGAFAVAITLVVPNELEALPAAAAGVPGSTAEGALGDVGWLEHAASIVERLATQTI
jgi:hypothetical protein